MTREVCDHQWCQETGRRPKEVDYGEYDGRVIRSQVLRILQISYGR